VQTCCATTYCSTGSTNFYADIAACLCQSGICKSQCSGAGNYCASPGSINSSSCNTCFMTNVAAGATCDPSAGTIASACSGDPACTAYLACANGCK